MKLFVLDLLRTVSIYLVIFVGGTSLFLFVAPIIGYLPYSDRPGPGWQELFPTITLEQLLQHAYLLAGWGIFLSIYAAGSGILLFLAIRLIEYLNVPRLLVQIIGALFTGYVSGILVLGIGWYIAIGEVAVTFSILLGALFGAWLLPKKSTSQMPHLK